MFIVFSWTRETSAALTSLPLRTSPCSAPPAAPNGPLSTRYRHPMSQTRKRRLAPRPRAPPAAVTPGPGPPRAQPMARVGGALSGATGRARTHEWGASRRRAAGRARSAARLPVLGAVSAGGARREAGRPGRGRPAADVRARQVPVDVGRGRRSAGMRAGRRGRPGGPRGVAASAPRGGSAGQAGGGRGVAGQVARRARRRRPRGPGRPRAPPGAAGMRRAPHLRPVPRRPSQGGTCQAEKFLAGGRALFVRPREEGARARPALSPPPRGVPGVQAQGRGRKRGPWARDRKTRAAPRGRTRAPPRAAPTGAGARFRPWTEPVVFQRTHRLSGRLRTAL